MIVLPPQTLRLGTPFLFKKAKKKKIRPLQTFPRWAAVFYRVRALARRLTPAHTFRVRPYFASPAPSSSFAAATIKKTVLLRSQFRRVSKLGLAFQPAFAKDRSLSARYFFPSKYVRKLTFIRKVLRSRQKFRKIVTFPSFKFKVRVSSSFQNLQRVGCSGVHSLSTLIYFLHSLERTSKRYKKILALSGGVSPLSQRAMKRVLRLPHLRSVRQRLTLLTSELPLQLQQNPYALKFSFYALLRKLRKILREGASSTRARWERVGDISEQVKSINTLHVSSRYLRKLHPTARVVYRLQRAVLDCIRHFILPFNIQTFKRNRKTSALLSHFDGCAHSKRRVAFMSRYFLSANSYAYRKKRKKLLLTRAKRVPALTVRKQFVPLPNRKFTKNHHYRRAKFRAAYAPRRRLTLLNTSGLVSSTAVHQCVSPRWSSVRFFSVASRKRHFAKKYKKSSYKRSVNKKLKYERLGSKQLNRKSLLSK